MVPRRADREAGDRWHGRLLHIDGLSTERQTVSLKAESIARALIITDGGAHGEFGWCIAFHVFN